MQNIFARANRIDRALRALWPETSEDGGRERNRRRTTNSTLSLLDEIERDTEALKRWELPDKNI